MGQSEDQQPNIWLNQPLSPENSLCEVAGAWAPFCFQVWGKEHDEEREILLSSLLSLLNLRRKELVDKLARTERKQEEVCFLFLTCF